SGGGWGVELLENGFDESTGIFTVGKVPFDKDMTLDDANLFLGQVFRGFPFINEDDHKNTRSLGGRLPGLLVHLCTRYFCPASLGPLSLFRAISPEAERVCFSWRCFTRSRVRPP
ncbi:MAG: hypothetical protein KJO79_05350, partial [Verrucomicrobiae bacterium]|nr:hypothetical protein [Verrucomicrobiae bacterium]